MSWIALRSAEVREVPGRDLEEALSQEAQRLVDPLLQVLADPLGVLAALSQNLIQELGEGGAAEEEIEVLEVLHLSLVEEVDQIHLVVGVEAEAGLTLVKAPQPTVGQQAPVAARDSQVVVNLVAGVGIGEGIYLPLTSMLRLNPPSTEIT